MADVEKGPPQRFVSAVGKVRDWDREPTAAAVCSWAGESLGWGPASCLGCTIGMEIDVCQAQKGQPRAGGGRWLHSCYAAAAPAV